MHIYGSAAEVLFPPNKHNLILKSDHPIMMQKIILLHTFATQQLYHHIEIIYRI